MKLEIIETSENFLAVSNEDIRVGDYVATKERFLDGTVKKQEDFDNAKWQLSLAYMEDMVYIERARQGKNAANGLCGCEKAVAYLPKGKKELSLPLLPEMSLNEDDLVEAIRIALHEVRKEKDERGIERVFSLTDAEVIERVKQSKTPKYFICETEGESPKTEKINGKIYLVGKYV